MKVIKRKSISYLKCMMIFISFSGNKADFLYYDSGDCSLIEFTVDGQPKRVRFRE